MSRTIIGTVSSKAGDKSIVVMVRTSKVHPIYRKRFTRSSKFMAHDQNNEAGVGDKVAIVETRPLSARKRFSLDKIIAKAGVQFRDEDAVADIPVEQAPEVVEQKPEAKPEPKKEVKAKKEKA